MKNKATLDKTVLRNWKIDISNSSYESRLELRALLKYLSEWIYTDSRAWSPSSDAELIEYDEDEDEWLSLVGRSRENANITLSTFLKMYGKAKYSIKGLYDR